MPGKNINTAAGGNIGKAAAAQCALQGAAVTL